MQVRVFESADMASGLKKIKEELGPDALILSTRTVRNGKLGLLGKPMLEITAAVDADLPQSRQGEDQYPGGSRQVASYPPVTRSPKIGFRHVVDDSLTDYLHQSAAERSELEPVSPKGAEPELQGEVKELRELVKNLATQVTKLAEKESSRGHQHLPDFKNSGIPAATQAPSLARQNDPLLALLIDRGINPETSRPIAGFLRQSLSEQQLSDAAYVKQTIISTIEEVIEVHPPEFAAGQKQQRIALVGPTGVGKTTTLAKIAAKYLSQHSSSIALITIDTYRIAAVEQLKVYGEIMRLPVEVVLTPEQLKQAIARHSDKELILIDTAGRSPRDSYCIDELTSFLPDELNIAKHLVLAAGSRENELLSTIERFGTLGINNTIFTKIDECATLGILLNVQLQNSYPLSYVTNGQRVPEDLLEISPAIVAQLIMSQNEGSLHD